MSKRAANESVPSAGEDQVQVSKKRKNLREFDESKRSNGVLIVEGKKFFIIKEFLANHSSVFETMFFGDFKESDAKEVELKDTNAEHFQSLLELINGENSLNDDNVEEILSVAHMYLINTAIERCKEFLQKESQKTLKEKFGIACQYSFVELKADFIAKATTISQLILALPDNVVELDNDTLKLFLEKFRELNKDPLPDTSRLTSGLLGPLPLRPVLAILDDAIEQLRRD